jgi:site-specific recombinase XerD
MKHLAPEAIGRLIEAAKTDRDRLLFSLLFQHGMRISECLALTKGSMQRGGYLRVRARKKGRHSDEKVNPQTLELWNRVTEHLCAGTMLFPVSRQWCDVLFHRACEKAGIELQPRMGVHCLRHSLGHALLDAGASLPMIQKSLRHRSLSSTSVYLEQDARDVDDWRARATHGAASAPAAPSLAEIRREIERLSKVAAAMQAEAIATLRSRRLSPVQAEASDGELRA